MKLIFFKCWAFLTRQTVVVLRDHDGQATLTVAKENGFGERVAKRFWPFNIRNVILNQDGTIFPDCYVERWKKV